MHCMAKLKYIHHQEEKTHLHLFQILYHQQKIYHPLFRSPHHPADGVPETTGEDVYPATGGEGSGFYPFYSRLNDGSSFFHTPILSFSKK